MIITVHDQKIRAELQQDGHIGRSHPRITGKLSPTEATVLIERLRGGECQADMADRCGATRQVFCQALSRVRDILKVGDDMELALLAYERGYVVIEDAP